MIGVRVANQNGILNLKGMVVKGFLLLILFPCSSFAVDKDSVRYSVARAKSLAIQSQYLDAYNEIRWLLRDRDTAVWRFGVNVLNIYPMISKTALQSYDRARIKNLICSMGLSDAKAMILSEVDSIERAHQAEDVSYSVNGIREYLDEITKIERLKLCENSEAVMMSSTEEYERRREEERVQKEDAKKLAVLSNSQYREGSGVAIGLDKSEDLRYIFPGKKIEIKEHFNFDDFGDSRIGGDDVGALPIMVVEVDGITIYFLRDVAFASILPMSNGEINGVTVKDLRESFKNRYKSVGESSYKIKNESGYLQGKFSKWIKSKDLVVQILEYRQVYASYNRCMEDAILALRLLSFLPVSARRVQLETSVQVEADKNCRRGFSDFEYKLMYVNNEMFPRGVMAEKTKYEELVRLKAVMNKKERSKEAGKY